MRTRCNKRLKINIARGAWLAAVLMTSAGIASAGTVGDDPDFNLDLDPMRHAASMASQGQLMVVTMPEIKIFPDPSVRSQRIGSFRSGDSVTVFERRFDDDGESWARVCARGACGWVGADFLEPAPSGKP